MGSATTALNIAATRAAMLERRIEGAERQLRRTENDLYESMENEASVMVSRTASVVVDGHIRDTDTRIFQGTAHRLQSEPQEEGQNSHESSRQNSEGSVNTNDVITSPRGRNPAETNQTPANASMSNASSPGNIPPQEISRPSTPVPDWPQTRAACRAAADTPYNPTSRRTTSTSRGRS